jgi:hypothetical protein
MEVVPKEQGHDAEKELASPADGNSSLDQGNITYQEGLDTVREKILIRKIDLHLIPMIMIIYLFSFLDRGKSLSAVHRHMWILAEDAKSTLEMLGSTAWRPTSRCPLPATNIKSPYQSSSSPTA